MRIKTGSHYSKLILLVLCDYANKKDICWPSINTISTDAEMSKSSVKKYLKELQKSGLIEIIQRQIDGNKNLTNVYKLNLWGSHVTTGGRSCDDPKSIKESITPIIPLEKRYGKYKIFQIFAKVNPFSTIECTTEIDLALLERFETMPEHELILIVEKFFDCNDTVSKDFDVFVNYSL